MSDPVIVKLINGDMFMATVINDVEDTLMVADPIAIRLVQVSTDGGTVEKTITQPFCALTLEREYSFDRRFVLFVKPLNPKIAKYYGSLLESFLNEQDGDLDNVQFNDEQQEEDQEEEPNLDEGFLIIPTNHNVH